MCQHCGAFVRGNDPDEEVDGSLNVFFRGFVVDSPAVLSASAQAGLFFAVNTAVDGDHSQIVGVHAERAGQVGIFPTAVLIERSLALAEFSLGLVGGSGSQSSAGGSGISGVEIPDVLEVVEVSAGDGGGLRGHAVVTELVVQRHIGQMAGETPAGGAVEAGRGECVEAELVSAGMDVVSDSLQGFEVGDLIDGVASLLKQSLVDDDAECLIAVADRQGLAVFTLEVESIGGHLIHDGSAVERIAVVAVGVDGALIAALEQGRSGTLVKFGCEGGVIGAGSSGDNLNGNTSLLGIGCSELLPSFVSFGFEVQVIDRASSFGRGGLFRLGFSGSGFVSGRGVSCLGRGVLFGLSGFGLGCAGSQAKNHHERQKHCDDLFHGISS